MLFLKTCRSTVAFISLINNDINLYGTVKEGKGVHELVNKGFVIEKKDRIP